MAPLSSYCLEVSGGGRKVDASHGGAGHLSSDLLFFVLSALLQQTPPPGAEAHTGSHVALAWWGVWPELG